MNSSGYILVIDDDAPITEFIADALTEEGYTVQAAYSGESARALIAKQAPDLLLCDLHMPGMTGTSLVNDLYDDALRNTPIIMMTADVHAARQLTNSRIDFCLIKPFDLDALFDCVATYVRHSSDDHAEP